MAARAALEKQKLLRVVLAVSEWERGERAAAAKGRHVRARGSEERRSEQNEALRGGELE